MDEKMNKGNNVINDDKYRVAGDDYKDNMINYK